MKTTNWQRADVTEHYLEQVRGGIPYGADQIKIMLQLSISTWRHFYKHRTYGFCNA